MTTTIKIEIDGQILTTGQCVWFEWAPCGCLSGVATVDGYGLDEAVAWQGLHESKRKVNQLRRRGYRFELGARSAIPSPWTDFTHEPKWEVAS